MANRRLRHFEILRHLGDRASWIVAEIADDVEVDVRQHALTLWRLERLEPLKIPQYDVKNRKLAPEDCEFRNHRLTPDIVQIILGEQPKTRGGRGRCWDRSGVFAD